MNIKFFSIFTFISLFTTQQDAKYIQNNLSKYYEDKGTYASLTKLIQISAKIIFQYFSKNVFVLLLLSWGAFNLIININSIVFVEIQDYLQGQFDFSHYRSMYIVGALWLPCAIILGFIAGIYLDELAAGTIVGACLCIAVQVLFDQKSLLLILLFGIFPILSGCYIGHFAKLRKQVKKIQLFRDGS